VIKSEDFDTHTVVVLLLVDEAGRVGASDGTVKIVINQTTFISLAIRKGKNPGPMLDPIPPLPLILLPRGPHIYPMPLPLPIDKLPDILLPIREFSPPLAIRQPILPITP